MFRFRPAEYILRNKWKSNWAVALHGENPQIALRTSKTGSRFIWFLAIVPGLIVFISLGLAAGVDKSPPAEQSMRGNHAAVSAKSATFGCGEQEIKKLLQSEAAMPPEPGNARSGFEISDPMYLGGEALQTIACNGPSGESRFTVRWSKSEVGWSLKQISRQRDG